MTAATASWPSACAPGTTGGWDLEAGLDRLRLALATAAVAARSRRTTGERAHPASVVPTQVSGGPDDEPPVDREDGRPEVAAPEGEQAEVHAIVERAQAGDAQAFGELYDRYLPMVHRYIAFRVGNAALAEDLTSETFLRALRRISSYTWQGRDIGAWFVTIARNLIADHFKSGRYRLELATSDLVEAGADRTAEGPENEVLDGITNATLLAAVRRLNPEQQECIALRFLQGLSVSETAEIMGKNDGAIKALQYRAVKSLGRLLPAELLS